MMFSVEPKLLKKWHLIFSLFQEYHCVAAARPGNLAILSLCTLLMIQKGYVYNLGFKH